MFVVYRKVLDLLLPVKMGGREMVNGLGEPRVNTEEGLCVCVCVCLRVSVWSGEVTGEGRRQGVVEKRQTPVLVDNRQSAPSGQSFSIN